MKLKGYTLSEIMIALVVLGTIIACCMPIISNMAPNKHAIMLKKAYFTTQQIISDLVNDSYYYPNGNLKDDVDEVTVSGTNITTSGNNKFPCLFASKLNLDTSNGHPDLQSICENTASDRYAYTPEGLVFNLMLIEFQEDNLADNDNKFISRIDVATVENPRDVRYDLGNPNDPNMQLNNLCYNYGTGWGLDNCTDVNILTSSKRHVIGKMAMFINQEGRLSLQTSNSAYAGAFQPGYGHHSGNVAQQNLINIITGKTSLLGKPKN